MCYFNNSSENTLKLIQNKQNCKPYYLAYQYYNYSAIINNVRKNLEEEKPRKETDFVVEQLKNLLQMQLN